MALQSLVGGYEWLPYLGRLTQNVGFQIDSSGEVAVGVFRVPRTGNVEGVEVYVSAVGNVVNDGLRCGLQSVTSGGLQSGTFLASGNAWSKFAVNTPAAAGWHASPDFAGAAAVAKGEAICVVFDIGTFTTGDDITIGALDPATIRNFPYGIFATSTRHDALPNCALRYDDNLLVPIAADMWPATVMAYTLESIDTGTTPDEIGLAFTLNAPRRLSAIMFDGALENGANFEIEVYDSGGNSVGGTGSTAFDGDWKIDTGGGRYEIQFEDDVDCAAGELYRVALLPTTTNNVFLYYNTFPSLAAMDAAEGGQGFYYTTRTNLGAWTDYNASSPGFRRPRLALGFSAVDDGTGGGGLAARVLGGTVVR